LREKDIEIVIQINGKVRGKIKASQGISQKEVEEMAKKEVERYLKDREIVKTIYVKDKLISFVIKGG
jgi:leucyl-tRNA synthetase